MIFVTVGHQTPFDRLVRLADSWAADATAAVFAQIGPSRFKPKHMTAVDFLPADEFEQYLDRCTAIVAHAGTGTIIQGLMRQKPMLVMPRLAKLGETRNDHQVSTAQYFEESGRVLAAYDDDQFLQRLDRIETFRAPGSIAGTASEQLITRVKRFVKDTTGKDAAAGLVPD